MLDQRIIQLYDEYTHKPLNRKDFIIRLAQLGQFWRTIDPPQDRPNGAD